MQTEVRASQDAGKWLASIEDYFDGILLILMIDVEAGKITEVWHKGERYNKYMTPKMVQTIADWLAVACPAFKLQTNHDLYEAYHDK